ncbi:MAG: NAD(P)-binding domain-containing protein, partial [Cyclobacteriaceae bacterium]
MSSLRKVDQNTTIGWIGTGVMGASMLSLIQQRGYDTIVYNRT